MTFVYKISLKPQNHAVKSLLDLYFMDQNQVWKILNDLTKAI